MEWYFYELYWGMWFIFEFIGFNFFRTVNGVLYHYFALRSGFRGRIY